MILRLLVLLALLLAVPATAQEDAPNGTISAESSAQSDADMANRIREILGEIGGYADVTVQVSEGVVTLRGTADSATDVSELRALVNRVEGVVAIKNEVMETADIIRRLNPAMERFQTRLTQLVTFLPLLAIAGVVLGLILWIGFAVARWNNPWDRIAPNAFIADIYRMLVRLGFGIVGVVIALDILDATALLSTILGAAGIIGLAVGFAVRDTVENFIASVMLSIRQPFGPNDVVEINGDQGKVIRLTSRATILLSFDGNHIRIPNATVFKSRIVNYSIHPQIRLMFTLRVALGADLAEAKRLAHETIAAMPFTVETPAPLVWLGEITDSGIEVIVTGWIDQRETSLLLARSEALRQVKRAFVEAGIEMPNATYTIELAGAVPAPGAAPTQPQPQPAPPPSEAPRLEPVTETTESALDAIVAAERGQLDTPDLLRDDALKE